MKSLDLKTWIILALLIAIAILFFMWPSKQPDNSLTEYQIKQREQTIHQLQEEAANELQRRRQDSIIHLEVISSKAKEESRLKSIIKGLKTKPIVIHVRYSVPEINELILTQDSVIQNLEAQNFIQSKYITELQGDIGEMKSNFEERLKLTQANFEDEIKLSEAYKKDLRKERRMGKLARVLIPVGVGIGLILGSQL